MRHIRLPIDASETYCEKCSALGTDSGAYGSGYPMCRVYRQVITECQGGFVKRLPECLAAEAADKAREMDAALGVAVRDAVRVFAHPAYGEIDTLTMMATILRKKQHGFDSTPAFLDAIATHLRTEET